GKLADGDGEQFFRAPLRDAAEEERIPLAVNRLRCDGAGMRSRFNTFVAFSTPNRYPLRRKMLYAAVCARSAAESSTRARASRSTRASAPGLTPSTARWRRNARAPGTAWNRPSRWRAMA